MNHTIRSKARNVLNHSRNLNRYYELYNKNESPEIAHNLEQIINTILKQITSEINTTEVKPNEKQTNTKGNS